MNRDPVFLSDWSGLSSKEHWGNRKTRSVALETERASGNLGVSFRSEASEEACGED